MPNHKCNFRKILEIHTDFAEDNKVISGITKTCVSDLGTPFPFREEHESYEQDTQVSEFCDALKIVKQNISII